MCATALVLVAVTYGFNFTGNNWESVEIDTTQWQTYTSERFEFSIMMPPDWIAVEFPNDKIAPRVNLYSQKQKERLTRVENDIPHTTPLTHHSPVLNVSIFPHGVPTEGFFGESLPSEISFSEGTRAAHDFVLTNGSRFATFAAFTKVPASWSDAGFIWGYALRKTTRTKCYRGMKRIADEACDPLTGDTVAHSARMSTQDREVQKLMLSSFTFINEQ